MLKGPTVRLFGSRDQHTWNRWKTVLMALLIFCINLVVIFPHLTADSSRQAWNNEFLYLSIARIFRDSPWTWNAAHYAGAPLSWLYPPLFPVLMAFWPAESLGKAFHTISGLAYALTPVALFFVGRSLFRDRIIALFVALAYSLFPSPIYYFLPSWKQLAASSYSAPWAFVALVNYNEAAHGLALLFILLTLALAWRERWNWAAVSASAVFLTNWAGVVGLVIVLVAMGVARTREVGLGRAALQTAGLAGTAYGLSAFWMSAGFFQTTQLLDQIVSRQEAGYAPWTIKTWLLILGVLAIVAVALYHRIAAYTAFTVVMIAICGAVLLSFSLADTALLPLPHRYALEANVGLMLGVGVLLRPLRERWRHAVMAVLLIAGLFAAMPFLSHAWGLQPSSEDPRGLASYEISQWLQKHTNGERVLVAGEVEGALNAWTSVPQVGGIRQGIGNYLVAAGQRELTLGCGNSARLTELWLRALNAPYAVVQEARSSEDSHVYVEPRRFDGLPVVWNNGHGDLIYQLPASATRQAVVVDMRALAALGPMPATNDEPYLERYVDWAQGIRPAAIHWSRPDRAAIDTNEAVLVKVNYDRGWHSPDAQTAADPLGFLLLRPHAGHQRITLSYGATWDIWAGRFLTLLTLGLLLAGMPLEWIGLGAMFSGLAFFALLSTSVPPQAGVARATFARVRPPLINPHGIVPVSTDIASIYGLNFGTAPTSMQVWVGGQSAEILYRGPNQINIRLPTGATPRDEVSVEVNGCRGNAFLLPMK